MRQRATQPTIMRIAIVGGGGFAFILAQQITQSANPVLLISRQVSRPNRGSGALADRLFYSHTLSLKQTFQTAKLPSFLILAMSRSSDMPSRGSIWSSRLYPTLNSSISLMQLVEHASASSCRQNSKVILPTGRPTTRSTAVFKQPGIYSSAGLTPVPTA